MDTISGKNLERIDLSLELTEKEEPIRNVLVEKTDRWNGCRVPYLTLDQVRVLKANINQLNSEQLVLNTLSIDFTEPAGLYTTVTVADSELNEITHYEPMLMEGYTSPVYPIGAYSWCWTEIEGLEPLKEDELQCTECGVVTNDFTLIGSKQLNSPFIRVVCFDHTDLIESSESVDWSDYDLNPLT